MLYTFSIDALRNKLRNSAIFIQMAVLTLAGVAPVLNVGSVGAEQLTSRKVTVSSSKPAQTNVDYDFNFSYATSSTVRTAILQFCDEPLGTCNLPTNMDLSSAAIGTLTQINTSATAGTKNTTDSNNCTDADGATPNMICFPVSAGTASSATDALVPISGITNPTIASGNFETVYVRISLYSSVDYSGTTPLFEGTVAASINQQLTISGRVQERLNFCVAAIPDNNLTDDDEVPQSMVECGALSTTVVDLGVIDNSGVAKSPVPNNPPATLGNNSYGIAMLNTNASNGTAITYFAEDDTTGGATNQLKAFRVPGATCNALTTTLTDQCFESAPEAGVAFVAGTEMFGVNIPCIVQNDGTFSTTGNLEAATEYNGVDNSTTTVADCEKIEVGVANEFAWNDTSAAVPLAQSSSGGTQVIDNEVVKLNFAATAGATTPTGSYTVVSTYIATPTF